MVKKLKAFCGFAVPFFVAHLLTSSAALAGISQSEKLILINNITRITGWVYDRDKESGRNGQTYYRFYMKENPKAVLIVSDLQALNDDVLKNERAVRGGNVIINPYDSRDYHFPDVEYKVAKAIVAHLGSGVQLISLRVLETGHTLASYKMLDESVIHVKEPSRIFNRVLKYGSFRAIEDQVIFPNELTEKVSQAFHVQIRSVSVTANGQLRLATEDASVILNHPDDLKDPKIFERVRNIFFGAYDLQEQVTLKRIQQNRNESAYLGAYVSAYETSFLFQNFFGEIRAYSKPSDYTLGKGQRNSGLRLCRDLTRK